MNFGYTNREMVKDLWSYIRPYKLRFFAGTFFRVSSDLVWLYPPYALGTLITLVSNYNTGDSLTPVWTIFTLLFCAAIYRHVFHEKSNTLSRSSSVGASPSSFTCQG